MILKKDIYMNEAGECKETTGGLPKGWQKVSSLEEKVKKCLMQNTKH